MSLDKAGAQKLTEQIRDNINQSAKLVQKAHEGQVWIALGLNSFAEWLKEAVGISRARGYQLLNIAKFEEQVRENLELPEDFLLTDRQSRIIAKHGLETVLEKTQEISDEDAEIIRKNGIPQDLTNLESLNEAIGELEIRDNSQAKKATDQEDPAPYFDEPVDANKTAQSFYTQFLYQMDDLPEVDETSPEDYRQIIEELEKSISNIDTMLDAYLKLDGDSK